MIGALWTGISGLSSHQQALDNESNNIANVNTIGFKSARVSFADQMYQDGIGKGSKTINADKLYTQGSLKLTGANYDMALNGDGFFTVSNKTNTGTSENYYTRAGNFKMGENGTLQDAFGNEVQGWMMTSIDTDNDVTSTNSNVNVFTNDYSKLLSSEIIRHETYIETITAKATDYSATAETDVNSIFSGDGAKNKSSKISDVEEAIKDYNSWLEKLKDEPDGSSSASISQVSQVNFKSGSESVIGKNGDQIYMYIDGNKYSQNFIPTTASSQLKADLFASDPITYSDPESTLTDEQLAVYDKAAGKIATYKALADKISQIPGLVATMVKEVGGTEDVLELDDSFSASTKNVDMLNGIMQIKSLIPGEQFTVSEVAETSGSTTVQGNTQTTSVGVKGSGIGAVETSRDALAKLISGKQQDVYTTSDLNLSKSPMYQYNLSIYDKELGYTLPVPNNGATPPVSVPLFIDATDANGEFTIDELVDKFNQAGSSSTPPLSSYVLARNVNNNLVIETLDSNYDVEFNGGMKQLPTYTINLNEIVDNSKYSFDLHINGNQYPIEMDYSTSDTVSDVIEYQDIRDKIKLEIDAINLANLSYELEVTQQTNGVFSIYTKNEDIDFSNSTTDIQDTLPTVSSLNINPISTPNVTYEKDKITVNEPLSNQIYSFNIMGVPVSYDNTGGTATSPDDIISSFKSQIEGSASLSPYINVSDDDNVIGTAGDGAVLTNGLNNLSEILYSSPEGKFMIEIPAGIADLTIYLNEFEGGDISGGDTIQIFTKDGKHISGTLASDEDWTYFNKNPKDIILNNPLKFNVGASYDSSSFSTNGGMDLSYYGPYTGDLNEVTQVVNYIDKDGNAQSRTIKKDEEMLKIINVTEPLVIFINGGGIYKTAAEWGSKALTGASSSSLVLTQTASPTPLTPTGLNITSLSGVVDEDITDFSSTTMYEHRFTITTDDTKSSSIYTLNLEGKSFEIKTDQTPTVSEIENAFQLELAKDYELNQKFQINLEGNDLVIQEKFSDYGYVGFSQPSSLIVKSLTALGDEYKTLISTVSNITPIDVNENYSGRKGAGAEFLEIINKVDQTGSQGSLQLRLDLLGITDSTFGEFSVDSTGLITMKQGGAEFAIGQASIAMFTNNSGLNPIGDNLLAKTNDSGNPIYSINNDKTGIIEGNTLELSTADLSQSLVNLMIFQRAFEANAKSITTSDELLSTLINLKR